MGLRLLEGWMLAYMTTDNKFAEEIEQVESVHADASYTGKLNVAQALCQRIPICFSHDMGFFSGLIISLTHRGSFRANDKW